MFEAKSDTEFMFADHGSSADSEDESEAIIKLHSGRPITII